MNSVSFDQILKNIGKHIIAYHASIGGSNANPDIPLPPPNGSGTLVRFQIEQGTIYGL